jgi:hypothetical protein
MTIIFNHIPKTGGITLRGILNKVYKPENIYFIESLDIAGSIQAFENMSSKERSKFKVIAGHGADFISETIESPFRVTILREPVSLFVSQYNFLRTNPGTIFMKEVKALKNIEDYLDYAILKGQDNLLTRYLSGSMSWLINPEIPIPNMENDGEKLLYLAKQTLSEYEAVLDLKTFDTGVFALSKKLGWKRIPIYRPQNQTKIERKNKTLTSKFEKRLKHALRFDIELYNSFLISNLDIAKLVSPGQHHFRMFGLRQKFLNFSGNIFKK